MYTIAPPRESRRFRTRHGHNRNNNRCVSHYEDSKKCFAGSAALFMKTTYTYISDSRRWRRNAYGGWKIVRNLGAEISSPFQSWMYQRCTRRSFCVRALYLPRKSDRAKEISAAYAAPVARVRTSVCAIGTLHARARVNTRVRVLAYIHIQEARRWSRG